MSLSAVVIDQDPEHLEMVQAVLGNLGLKVTGVSGPEFCQTYRDQSDSCRCARACHDIMIVNNLLTPKLTGLEFINWRKQRGCRMPPENCAVMSVVWPPSEIKTAADLALKTFVKPFLVKDLVDWIYRIKNTMRCTIAL